MNPQVRYRTRKLLVWAVWCLAGLAVAVAAVVWTDEFVSARYRSPLYIRLVGVVGILWFSWNLIGTVSRFGRPALEITKSRLMVRPAGFMARAPVERCEITETDHWLRCRIGDRRVKVWMQHIHDEDLATFSTEVIDTGGGWRRHREPTPEDEIEVLNSLATPELWDAPDDTLSEPERVFRAVWDLEGALPDGGLFDYLSRPGDIDMTEIVSAYRAIGAIPEAVTLERVPAIFGDEGPAADFSTRQLQLFSLTEEQRGRLTDITVMLRAGSERVARLVYAYVVSHGREVPAWEPPRIG